MFGSDGLLGRDIFAEMRAATVLFEDAAG